MPDSESVLEPGDRLSRDEFERRYERMPHLKKAELIEGIVPAGFLRARQPAHPSSGQSRARASGQVAAGQPNGIPDQVLANSGGNSLG